MFGLVNVLEDMQEIGETMDIEENLVSSFARKRLCIKTKQADNILEKFKVIFKRKVYMARAKELFTWTLIFLDHKESEYISDHESLHGAKNKPVGSQHGEYDLVDDSDVEGVTQDSDSSLSHPPGFTPEVSRQENDHRGLDLNTETDKVNSPLVHTKVMNNSHKVHENVTSNGESAFNYSHNAHNGGLTLEVLDDMIRATIFKKDYATVSDNFIAIYGTWISNNSKVLIVVIYAPQSLSHKRVLCDYISFLIARWNGETIVMGDFNEVRSIDERFGSIFNQSSSRLFNHFIASSGHVDVKLEGYSFTWAHPSATKMSKLDRFLVSENTNGLIRFKKKLQDLKKIIRSWIKDKKLQQSGAINSIKKDLIDIDKNLDSGNVSDEGDENSKSFHGIINKKRSQLSIHGVFVDGDWNTDPEVVKDVVSRDEIHIAVWNCGENKSPGPDGATSDGLFKGIQIQGSMAISHLFYTDDAIFIGEWSDSNLDNIVKILKCFFLVSGLKIIIQKSQVLGVGVPRNIVYQAASWIGCAIMQNSFRYLGVMVEDNRQPS
nr:RNA-directed DNA polymerase, eukaryota [Tanacetum cinerariifolium]